MGIPADRAALLAAIHDGYAKLSDDLARVPAE